MQLAKVLGQVVSTVKEPGLSRFTLLVVQDASGADPERSSGPAYVAVDVVGAGVGEIVLVAPAGRPASPQARTLPPPGRSSPSPTPSSGRVPSNSFRPDDHHRH